MKKYYKIYYLRVTENNFFKEVYLGYSHSRKEAIKKIEKYNASIPEELKNKIRAFYSEEN